MNKKVSQGKPFSNMEISAFCGQISLILKSGISSMEGITIMLEDAASGEEKAILEQILERTVSFLYAPYGGNRRGDRYSG